MTEGVSFLHGVAGLKEELTPLKKGLTQMSTSPSAVMIVIECIVLAPPSKTWLEFVSVIVCCFSNSVLF